MSKPVRAFITGCMGLQLSPEEREFIRNHAPWGLILFKRNIESPEQVTRLTREFRELAGREDAPVLIDQEGGPGAAHGAAALAQISRRCGLRQCFQAGKPRRLCARRRAA